MDALQGILPDSWLPIVTAIVAICAAVATILPTPVEGGSKIYRVFHGLISWLAFNFGKAKNADDPAAKNTNGSR